MEPLTHYNVDLEDDDQHLEVNIIKLISEVKPDWDKNRIRMEVFVQIFGKYIRL